jgi:hypothetical protein
MGRNVTFSLIYSYKNQKKYAIYQSLIGRVMCFLYDVSMFHACARNIDEVTRATLTKLRALK